MIQILIAFKILLTAAAEGPISAYQDVHKSCDSGRSYAIREFSQGGVEKYLLVDTMTLKTQIADVRAKKSCFDAPISPGMNQTPFFQAVNKYNSSPQVQSTCQGFKSFPSHCKSDSPMVLTTDLCPSDKSFDHWKSSVLDPFIRKLEPGTSIVFSITGDWIRNHPKELVELKNVIAKNKLVVTWANHSDSHGIHPDHDRQGNPVSTPERQAFLTQETTEQFQNEVFNAEITMLENGLTPSPFFRFPGLFSTQGQIQKLHDLGMIPLNTSAWVALGTHENPVPDYFSECGMSDDQKAKPGRIILTHSTSNSDLENAAAAKLANSKSKRDFISVQEAVVCDVKQPAVFNVGSIPAER